MSERGLSQTVWSQDATNAASRYGQDVGGLLALTDASWDSKTLQVSHGSLN